MEEPSPGRGVGSPRATARHTRLELRPSLTTYMLPFVAWGRGHRDQRRRGPRVPNACVAPARPPPSALVEGRRAPSSTCSACNKLVGQLPQSWPFVLGGAGFSHHEGAFYRSTVYL